MLRKVLFLSVFLTLTAAAYAQAPATPVWSVDYVRIKDGQHADYSKFIVDNWAKAREFMKRKGIVKSYIFRTTPAGKDTKWDALLITEFVDQAGFDQREAVFEDYRKSNPIVPVKGKTAREMSEIKLSRNYSYAVPTEVWGIVLETQNSDLDIAAVRIPLEYYLSGHATGNPDVMRKAFHTEGKLIFMREGKYTTRTFEEYVGGMKDGKPAPDESRRKRWIESIDVAGNAAMAKIILDYPAVRFVDYMSLLKIDGEWKIINKSFYAEPKAQKKE